MEIRGKKLRITQSTCEQNWYHDYVGREFTIQSESKDKKCYVVRTKIEEAGWPYGWIDKSDCELLV
jgi:hypothetical protein